MAVTLKGTPLGLTAAKFWTRTKFKGTWTLKRHVNPTRVPIETKESYRWLENLRQWKVIQTVRERFSCQECETIAQPSAPFHVILRAHAGPNLLAVVLFEKLRQHGDIDLPLSTLADHVGACAAALRPLHSLIKQHVVAAERLHGDDIQC